MPDNPLEYEGSGEEIAGHSSEFEGCKVRLTILARESDEDNELTLEERQAFLKLPLDERRRILAEQAEKVAPYYQSNPEWKEILEGDVIDY